MSMTGPEYVPAVNLGDKRGLFGGCAVSIDGKAYVVLEIEQGIVPDSSYIKMHLIRAEDLDSKIIPFGEGQIAR